MMKIVLTLLLAFAFIGQVVAGTSPYAEIVIINGQVITADNDDPSQVTIAEAVAIQGDKILEVGTNAEIQALVADWTEVIDAKGNSVTPGY
ncbi:MAG: amidohydrolase, partial [Gammaproteobacteria bacterium]|nr:amidohydrolase [Gammaproteobacteria bacterium]